MRKKVLSIFLVLCMVCTMLPVSAMAEEVDTTGASGEIISFATLTEAETEKTVAIGTSFEDLDLPKTLTAMVLDKDTVVDDSVSIVTGPAIEITDPKTTVDIPVTWFNPNYDGNTEGEYIFTPVIHGYTVKTDVLLPQITVTVEAEMMLRTFGMPTEVDNFSDLQTAINSATGDLNIKLSDSYSDTKGNLTIQSTNNYNITIDLNGKMLSNSKGSGIIHNGSGMLTISGGNVGGYSIPSSAILINGNGSLTVKNTTVKGEYTGIESNSTGTVSIQDSEVKVNNTGIYIKNPEGKVELFNSNVSSACVVNSSPVGGIGVYTSNENTISIEGTSVIQGPIMAMNHSPLFDSDMKVTVSTEYWGKNAEPYVKENIDKYEYFKVEPAVTSIWVGGVEVTDENKDGITGEGITGSVTYDPGKNILTLNGVSIKGNECIYKDGDKHGIYAKNNREIPLKLKLIGDSTIEADNNGKGICAEGDLIITGEGSLSVTGGDTTEEGETSYGIYIYNGILTVEEGIVIAKGGSATGSYSCSYGIGVQEGNLTIESKGKVTASGGNSSQISSGVYLDSEGYYNVNLTVDGGSLEANGGKSNGDYGGCYGIYAYDGGNITIKNKGKVVATGGNSNQYSSGVFLNSMDFFGEVKNLGNLTVDGSSLEATGGKTTVDDSKSASYGIGVQKGNINIINEGAVKAIGGDANYASFGVVFYGDDSKLTVDGGSSMEAEGGASKDVSYGIYFQKPSTLTVESGTLTATGGSADEESGGVYAYASQVIVNDGIMTANGGYSGNVSFGIYSDDITINGGTVNAYSGVAEISQAMSSVPNFNLDYNHIIKAGEDGAKVKFVKQKELNDNIYSYKIIEIEPLIHHGIWIGDEEVTNENQDRITCEHIRGTVTYDPDSATLTLNGAEITDSAYSKGGNKYGIYAEGDLNIMRIGDNSITIPKPEEDKDGAGIYVTGSLTISGDGNLKVTGGPATEGDHGDSYGIHVDGDLTVDGGDLIAFGAPAAGSNSSSYGICVHDGNMNIKNNGNVIANGDNSNRISFGVYFVGSNANLTVESGSLTTTGGNVVADNLKDGLSYGVYFAGESAELMVNGGILTAKGGDATGESCGIYVNKVIVNNNTTLEASGGFGGDTSFGISSSNIIINGGKMEVASGEGDISKAMTSAPTFGSGYTHRNNAGTNSGDAIFLTDAEFTRAINGFKYIEITPYIPSGDGGNSGGGNSGGGNSGGGNSGGSSTDTLAPAPSVKPSEPVTGTIESKATVNSTGTASISITEQNITDAIANAKAEAEKNGSAPSEIKIVINVSTDGKKKASNLTINLPKTTQQQIINNEIAGIELVFDRPDITVGFDQLAITEINRQANADVEITVSKTDNSKLSNDAKKAIGKRPVYDFKASYKNGSKNKNVTNFGSGMVYASIPYTPANGEAVGYLHGVYVNSKGKISPVPGSTYDTNSKSLLFSTNHFSVYGVGYTAPSAKYTDIGTNWAKDSIDYVVGRGLLSGTTKTTFSPDSAMTREVLVMALGKLAGVDTKAYTTNSFTDVKAGSSYRPYIEWAYTKGIIQGISDGKFAPDRAITREEIAVIMVNYAKVMDYKLSVNRSAIAFEDASSIGSNYAETVKSMQQAGILMGETNNKFNPKANVTRAEVSAMIHRLVKLTIDPTTAQGWAQNDDGQYMYYKNSKEVTGWQTIDGVKYFFDTYGIMASRKWVQIDGKWYYFNADGTLARSTKIDEFEVDENGVRKTK